MNKTYWNKYYDKTPQTNLPSAFAQFVLKHLDISGGSLLDVGCGNGRDSIFFYNKGYVVTAIDASETAITSIMNTYPGIQALCVDFTKNTFCRNAMFNYVYSRFSVHAITLKQEKKLLSNVYSILPAAGLFFIETRTIDDELFGKGTSAGKNAFYFDGHYRRFIVKEDLEQTLTDQGFKVLYSAKNRGWAVNKVNGKTANPVILRIIAQK